MISRRIILSIGPCLALPAQAQTRPAPGQPQSLSFSLKLAEGAERRASKPETYDPAYVVLSYPMGDVPDDRGVCSDTVIRAFRYAGVDLQREVHEDMSRHFAVYPRIWGLSRPDRNIDHRRVPNLETLFRRKGGARPVSRHGSDYRPGDVVSWRLSGSGLPHIGVLSRSPGRDGPQVVHNIGAGSQIEDVLFSWPIEGWFRFETWGGVRMTRVSPLEGG